jgi:glycine dehydrogenase subunit 1
VTRYTSATDADRAEMLAAIGVDATAELFEQIPEPLRLGRPLELPDGLSEAEVYERLAALAARNADAEEQVCFVGAGMYDHYVPAIVDAITQRSEFLTPYTPYQPEISQGGLQAMFEFQTAMSELTGLPVSNAGLYEGPSSLASAGYLAMGATGRRRQGARRPARGRRRPDDARHPPPTGRVWRRHRPRRGPAARQPA